MAKIRLRKPREPGVGECCGSGCTRCVWDVYYDDLAKYEAARAASGASVHSEGNDRVNKDRDADSDTSLISECSYGDEEEYEDSDSDSPVNFIGAVVVKFIEKPPHLDSAAAEQSCLRDLAQRYQIAATVADCELVSSSDRDQTSSSPASPICVMNVQLSQPLTAQPCAGDVINVFMPNSATRDRPDVCCTAAGEHYRCTNVRCTNVEDDRRFSAKQDTECEHRTTDRVGAVCDLLALAPDAWCELHRSPFVPEEHFPPWLPQRQPMTVRLLLTYYVDIASSSYLLRPTFFECLLNIYELQLRRATRQARQNTSGKVQKSDDNENNGTTAEASASVATQEVFDTWATIEATPELLRALCAKEGTAELYRELTQTGHPGCYPCLEDVLRVFRFVRVPLARLLEMSSPLRARQFSLADWFSKKSNTTMCCDCNSTSKHQYDLHARTNEAMIEQAASSFTHIQLCVRQLHAARPSWTELNARMVHPVALQLAILLNKASTLRMKKDVVSRDACASEDRMCRCSSTHSYFRGNISYPLCAKALRRHTGSAAGSNALSSSSALQNCYGTNTKVSEMQHLHLLDSQWPNHQHDNVCRAQETTTASSACPSPVMYVGICALGGTTPFARELSTAVQALLLRHKGVASYALARCGGGGACTAATVAARMLSCSRAAVAATVHEAAAPLLLVGAGTGMAPMMAAVHTLLRYRQKQEHEQRLSDRQQYERAHQCNEEICLPCDAAISQTAFATLPSEKTSVVFDSALPCMVFYGARNMSELVYDRTLEEACRCGAVQRYERSVSRELATPTGEDRMAPARDPYAGEEGGCGRVQHGRVTDLLRMRAAVIRRALLEAGGRLFACGPAGMLCATRDVLMKEVLVSSEEKSQGVDGAELQRRMSALEADSRVMFDSWSKMSVFE